MNEWADTQIVYLDADYIEQHAPLNGVPIVDALEMVRSVDLVPMGFCMVDTPTHPHKHGRE